MASPTGFEPVLSA